MKRPRVIMNCVADHYADKARERIIEFSFPGVKGSPGGLVSFTDADDGRLEAAARALADSIWTAETGQAAPAAVLDKAISRATAEGRISFRRVVQALVPLIAAKGW